MFCSYFLQIEILPVVERKRLIKCKGLMKLTELGEMRMYYGLQDPSLGRQENSNQLLDKWEASSGVSMKRVRRTFW